MEDKRDTSLSAEKSPIAVIAGVLFLILAFLQLVYAYTYYNKTVYLLANKSLFYEATTLLFFWILAYSIIGMALFRQKKDLLLVVGFSLLALLSLRSFLVGFGEEGVDSRTNMTYHFTNGVAQYKFNIFCTIPNLLNLLGTVGMLVIIIASVVLPLAKCKNLLKVSWYIPAVLVISKTISSLLLSRTGVSGEYFNIFNPIETIRAKDLFYSSSESILTYLSLAKSFLFATGILLSGMWCALPNKISCSTENTKKQSSTNDNAYCGIAKHVLLLLFTFGIWYYIWIYRTTNYLNCIEDEPPRNPTNKLLLCLFVPFYSIYWIYKSAQRIDKLANSKGISSELSTLCLILAIFVGIIPPILIQDKINTVVVAKGNPAPTFCMATDIPEELKKYKTLLDDGVITQEEFDTKKRQLLGL